MSATNPICSKVVDLERVSNDVKKVYSDYFDNLLKTLNIDKEKNKEYANQYYSLVANINAKKRSIRVKNFWKWALLIFLIFPFIILNNQVKRLKQIIIDLESKAKEYQKKLIEQLEPLWSNLSAENICKNVLEKVLTDYTFSRTISLENNNVWNGIVDSFQIEQTDTFTNLYTGTIYDHPFLVFKLKQQKWVDVPYVGTGVISYRDSKGNHQTEVVTATVLWPYPFYESNNYLAFKSNIARDLIFTNIGNAGNVHKIKKMYKKGKMERMDNEEFDRLFPMQRNDELQYRVIFTVLTQEKYVNLIKSIGSFNMFKAGLYTNVYFPNRQVKKKVKKESVSNIEPSTNINYDFNEFNPNNSYDLDQFKNEKLLDIASFVTTFGTLQLPITNLPVYSREYYKENDKPLSNKTCDIQDEVFSNISYNRIFGKKYPTDVIVHTKTVKSFTQNTRKCFISEAILNYFVPFPKPVPALAVGVHGSKMINVIVQDFRPRSEKYYLLQAYGYDSKHDLCTRTNAKILNGILYKLFDHQPSEDEIKSELTISK